MKIIYTLLLLLFAHLARAQQAPDLQAAKAIYLEVAGSSPGVSLNYDTRFRPGLTGLGLRAGVGLMGGFSEGSLSGYTAPILFNYVIGSGRLGFEVGAGVTLGYVSRTGTHPLIDQQVTKEGPLFVGGTGNLGLRLQPAGTGLHVRLYWSPFLTSEGLAPGRVGLSLGLGFR